MYSIDTKFDFYNNLKLVMRSYLVLCSYETNLRGEKSSVESYLKGQCHEIFDPLFFRQSITPRPLINTLKYFRILFRIRRAIYENVLIPRYAA
jgi:hypothetical protein